MQSKPKSNNKEEEEEEKRKEKRRRRRRTTTTTTTTTRELNSIGFTGANEGLLLLLQTSSCTEQS